MEMIPIPARLPLVTGMSRGRAPITAQTLPLMNVRRLRMLTVRTLLMTGAATLIAPALPIKVKLAMRLN